MSNFVAVALGVIPDLAAKQKTVVLLPPDDFRGKGDTKALFQPLN